jgi:hypothetical protein
MALLSSPYTVWKYGEQALQCMYGSAQRQRIVVDLGVDADEPVLPRSRPENKKPPNWRFFKILLGGVDGILRNSIILL